MNGLPHVLAVGVQLIVDETEADGAFINAVLSTLEPSGSKAASDGGRTHE